MEISVHSVDLERHDISTRMPFKYGIATMTHVPHLFVRAEVSFDGEIQTRIKGAAKQARQEVSEVRTEAAELKRKTVQPGTALLPGQG